MNDDQELIQLVKEKAARNKTGHFLHVAIEAEQNLPLSPKRRLQLEFIITCDYHELRRAAFYGEDIYYPVSTKYKNHRLNVKKPQNYRIPTLYIS